MHVHEVKQRVKVESAAADSVRARWSNCDPLSAFALYVLIAISLFADVLFTSGDRVLSRVGVDLSNELLATRAFGFGELRTGNIPLWNPHLFSGQPFMADFQSALFYPLNLIFLLLPLAKAINISFALHLVLAAWFMYGWARYRGGSHVGALFAGMMLMLGGPYFPHIQAGHLSDLCAMAWIPALFWSVDYILDHRDWRGPLLGMAVVAMQILAGHPQYVYFSGIAVSMYVLLRLVNVSSVAWAIGAMMVMGLGAATLTTVQLWSGLAANAQSARSLGIDYAAASSFPFPPENLLTLVAPWFFGDGTHDLYWGRWYFWESSLFFGVSGLVLALPGACQRLSWRDRSVSVMIILLLVLALGKHTPVHGLLYVILPGFDLFRGASKFIVLLAPFAALLGGWGLDRLLARRFRARAWCLACAAAGTTCALAAIAVYRSASGGSGGVWFNFMHAIAQTGEAYAEYGSEFPGEAGFRAALCLIVAALSFAIIAVAVAASRRWPMAVYGIVLVGAIELLLFSRLSIETFRVSDIHSPRVSAMYTSEEDTFRIWYVDNPQYAMLEGGYDVWGPHVPLQRYAEFVALTQGADPDRATEHIDFRAPHPLLALLRCKAVIHDERVAPIADALPRALLVYDYTLAATREARFARLLDSDFDPRAQVILEREPAILPAKTGAGGDVKLLEADTDQLVYEVTAPAPALLLLSENYSPDWRAEGLGESADRAYELMPANHTLMAIPLDAGHHTLRIGYRPVAFLAGRWISLAALVVYLGVLAYVFLVPKRGRATGESGGC